jgi:hypothetical protein
VRFGIGLPFGFLRWMRLMKPWAARCLVLLGAVGGVSPDPARRVGPVEEPDELRAVVTGRIGRAPGPDQPMAPVDAEMVLVAEE